MGRALYLVRGLYGNHGVMTAMPLQAITMNVHVALCGNLNLTLEDNIDLNTLPFWSSLMGLVSPSLLFKYL